MARALDAKPAADQSRREFYDRLDPHHLAPLWEVLSQILVKEPKTAAIPHRWDYTEVRPYLLESAALISAAEAERRVLVLENPGMRGRTALTETLYGGLQIIMPGEVAPAHRHTPSALRFIVEGQGAYTAVNGERAYMEPGDLILTPSWCWHDHGHDGDAPVVWLDGLDIPLMNYLGPIFTELYPAESFPAGRPGGDTLARYGANLKPMGEARLPPTASPMFHYPYSQVRKALLALAQAGDLDSHHGVKMEYVNPTTGGSVMPTLSTYMQFLPDGFIGESYRSTAAWAYCVVEGSGRTQVGDRVLDWAPQDVFVVPSWYPHHHVAAADSVLFSFSDRGLQEKLGIWRERRSTI